VFVAELLGLDVCVPVVPLWAPVAALEVPDCEGVWVWLALFEPLLLAVVDGLAVALPVLDTAPPWALVGPEVCVKPTDRKFCDVPPATAAVL